MNKTIFRLSLDIHEIYSQATISIKRWDTTGRLIITLMEGGKPYHIDEGCYAVFTCVKKDGAILHNDCIIQNNQIIYDFSKTTTSTAERMGCEIIVYDENGEVLISPRFTIIVYDSVYSEVQVESSHEYLSLINTLSEAKAMISNVESKLKNGELKGDRGATGAKVVSTVLIEQTDEGNVYEQTFDDGTTATFTAPKGVKGDEGAIIISTVLIGQDENGGNIYEQTFQNGKTATFTAPKGLKGDPFTYEDFTSEQLAGLKGEKGDTPTLQDWLGTKPIGDNAHYIYYDGAKFVERPVSIKDETTEWAQIATMSAQISSGEKTPEELGLAVGQERTVTLTTGEKITLQIWGFSHDDLADGGGKAGITFGMKNLLKTKYSFGGSDRWSSTSLRIDTMQTIFATLPDELKDIIKVVKKHVFWGNPSQEDTVVADKLFLFSCKEIGYSYCDGSYCTTYNYWIGKDDITRTKSLSNGDGALSGWLLRDTRYSNGEGVYVVGINGGATCQAFTETYGICFGFCI